MTAKSYEERLKKALAGAPMKRLLPVMIQWKVNDQRIVGRILDIETIKGKKDKGSFRMYKMECDNCIAKFTLGAQIDQIFPGNELIGRVIAITYLGTEDIGGGKHMKNFDIMDLTEETDTPDIPGLEG